MNIIKNPRIAKLLINWSVSKGRDTYGYDICTLWDGNTPYRTCGGGYDMLGTVFGEWLQAHFLDRFKELQPDNLDLPYESRDRENYGYFCKTVGDTVKYWLDGATGLDTMIGLAKKVGIRVEQAREGRKGNLVAMFVWDERDGTNESKGD